MFRSNSLHSADARRDARHGLHLFLAIRRQERLPLRSRKAQGGPLISAGCRCEAHAEEGLRSQEKARADEEDERATQGRRVLREG